MVEKPQEIGIDDLIRKMPLEERLYRHRCVEAWSMAIPWSGFPLAKLVELAKPLSSAKYLRMETFLDPEVASGQRQTWYPWPYVEGLTMAEATNELAFLVTGAYGKPVTKQMGAPLRLALPWKYGFKSIKSIMRFSFTDKRPKSFWEALQASEYGFWANVNPEVPHPRWSQATEELIGRRRAAADAAVQRLRRLRRAALQGRAEGRAPVGVTVQQADRPGLGRPRCSIPRHSGQARSRSRKNGIGEGFGKASPHHRGMLRDRLAATVAVVLNLWACERIQAADRVPRIRATPTNATSMWLRSAVVRSDSRPSIASRPPRSPAW